MEVGEEGGGVRRGGKVVVCGGSLQSRRRGKVVVCVSAMLGSYCLCSLHIQYVDSVRHRQWKVVRTFGRSFPSRGGIGGF